MADLLSRFQVWIFKHLAPEHMGQKRTDGEAMEEWMKGRPAGMLKKTMFRLLVDLGHLLNVYPVDPTVNACLSTLSFLKLSFFVSLYVDPTA